MAHDSMKLVESDPDTITLEEYRRRRETAPAVHVVRWQEKTDQ